MTDHRAIRAQLVAESVPDPEAPTPSVAHLGLGLAAAGRPAYITTGRVDDLGDPASRTVEAMRVRAHELLDAAWDSGIRYVDVARSYGFAEEFLGTWLAQHQGRRSGLTIGSKWGYEYVGNWRVDAVVHERKDHSVGMFDTQWPETVRALDTRPDIYLIHSVTPDSPALHDLVLLDRLRALADTGIRVGISTSGPSQAGVIAEALALVDTPFRAVQATWNLLEQSAARALQLAHDAGWLVVVKEVLANGRLTDSAAPALVLDVAATDGQPVQGLAVGAALAQPWADIVLTGAVTPDHIRANTAARITGSSRDAFDALATSPADYWRARSLLPWS